jgi:hypothetical protein
MEENRTRPVISQMVINEFSKVVDSQDEKGIEKYNRTIDDAKDEDYDWNIMALEESVDLNKYAVRRILQLMKEVNKLKDEVEFLRNLKGLE